MWITEYSEIVVRLSALFNIMAIVIVYHNHVDFMINMNMLSLILMTWLVYNPYFINNPQLKEFN